jgi:ATP-dependent DNA ligase
MSKKIQKVKKVDVVIDSESVEEEEEEEIPTEKKTLPPLFVNDTNGKLRVWKCWVTGDTVHREHGLVTGKKVTSTRVFEGKNIGKKNETTPEEQAWNEANKEWVAHIDKEYVPDKKDKEGTTMMRKLKVEKEKSGGHNINSVATTTRVSKNNTKNNTNTNTASQKLSTTVKSAKTISRKKTDTCMVDEIIGGAVIPMKAQLWELADESDPHSVLPKVSKYFLEVTGKGKNATTEPTDYYVQAKLDGIRCRMMVQTNSNNEKEVVMTSNSGKQFPWFKSIRDAMLEWLGSLKNTNDLLDGLDGELYAMEFTEENGTSIPMDARFSTISSICGLSRSNPHPLEGQIQFHCFDMFDRTSTLTQVERFKHREALFKSLPQAHKSKIIKVETKTLSNLEDIVEYHAEQAALGYEGIILRTFGLKYRPKARSPEMRKFKMFLDAEYEIVGCKLDKGTTTDNFVWVLKTEDGKEFSCKPMGTREQKIEWYKNRKGFVGKFVTVKYQELSEDGVPRFPIGKAIRAGVGID